MLVVELQAGVGPLQLLSAVHCTQVLVLMLQTGVEPLQSMFCVHCTHVALELPLAPLHTDVLPEQIPPLLPQTQA